MAAHSIQIHQFSNGLTLIGEAMPWLESAAFAVSVPAGCRHDPADKIGLANFVCEMVQRGCGNRSSRQFVEDLEYLGVDYSASVSGSHTSFGGAMPAESLLDAFPIFADLLRRPAFPAEQFEEGRLVCLQEARAIEDDLAQQVMIELKQRRYPEPLGRHSVGTLESIQRMESQDIPQFFSSYYRPNETIVSVAGKIDWPGLVELIEQCLGDWETVDVPELQIQTPPGGSYHLDHDSQQTHVGLAYPSLPYAHPDYFKARGAVGVLSDGMSSRLFTEVREKRGLCYTVYASHHSLQDRGSIVCYAGTSAERAQETLDVLVGELERLKDGITDDELRRLKIQIKSSLLMQQESSRSRAGSIAGDWYHLGRVRSSQELQSLIEQLSIDDVNSYLTDHPPCDFNLVTLGKEPLEFPGGISTAST